MMEQLDALRGGPNSDELHAMATRLINCSSIAALEVELVSLRDQKRALHRRIKENMEETGNPWGMVPQPERVDLIDMYKYTRSGRPPEKMVLYRGEDPEDAMAKQRAAKELREQGEEEAARLLETWI